MSSIAAGKDASGDDSQILLTPFTAKWLPAVQPWFEHPEVRLRLGGPDWPERELQLMDTGIGHEYRGRTVLRTHSWVAIDEANTPLAHIGGDVYDRWTRWDGSQPDRPVVTAVETGPAMGLAFVVDPALWGQGIGRSALRAVLQSTEVDDVRLFAAGIDFDNHASRNCAAAVGFATQDPHPDWEDTVYYLLRRIVPHGPSNSPS